MKMRITKCVASVVEKTKKMIKVKKIAMASHLQCFVSASLIHCQKRAETSSTTCLLLVQTGRS